MDFIERMCILFGSLTIVGAAHFLFYLGRYKGGIAISVRTFALFFALNAFFFNLGLFRVRWTLFTICFIACILNGLVLLKNLGRYS